MKKLLKLKEESLDKLRSISESGMGYYFLNATVRIDISEIKVGNFIVTGDNYLIPMTENGEIYRYNDFVASKNSNDNLFPIDVTATNIQEVSFEKVELFPYVENIKLPINYKPTAGAIALIGKIKLTKDTIFYRYIGSALDLRFNKQSEELVQDTYLTTFLDQKYANSGFAAVGRYALPLPIPSSYVHEYVLPKNTELQVGTALPMFGQSGGGVEVKTIINVKVNQPTNRKINDY